MESVYYQTTLIIWTLTLFYFDRQFCHLPIFCHELDR